MRLACAPFPLPVNDFTFGWLIGILEGEGSFLAPPPSKPNSPVVSVEITDYDTAEKIGRLWGVSPVPGSKQRPHYLQPYIVRIKGHRAVAFMRLVRPYMSNRRQKQIDRAIETFNPNYGKLLTQVQATEIRIRFRGGELAKDLAKEFGISHWSVYAIHQERIYTGDVVKAGS